MSVLSGSNYIIHRDPMRFGGQQEDYESRSEKLVLETSKRFQEAVAGNENLESVFHEVMETLGAARCQIACDHKTDEWEDFGARRDASSCTGYLNGLPLGGVYESYIPRVRDLFVSFLSSMKHDTRTFHETSKDFILDKCEGRTNYYSCKIYTGEHSEDWLFDGSEENFVRMFNLIGEPVPKAPFDFWKWQIQLRKYDALKKLKEVSPDNYEKLMRFYWISVLREMKPELLKSVFAQITLYFQIDEEMVPITHFTTWLYRDFKEDPVVKMERTSLFAIYVQDRFENAKVLSVAARVFATALQWKPEEAQAVLQNRMALWSLLFRNAMPFMRGTCAIADWMEKAVYHAHGLRMIPCQDKLQDLEALTSAPAQFIAEYPLMVRLEANQ